MRSQKTLNFPSSISITPRPLFLVGCAIFSVGMTIIFIEFVNAVL